MVHPRAGVRMSDEHCIKCGGLFDENDKRFLDSTRRYRQTPFCHGCIEHCRDSEIADHWCTVDQWRTDNQTFTV